MASPPEFITHFSKLIELHTEEIRLAKRNEHSDALAKSLDNCIFKMCGISDKQTNAKHLTSKLLISLGYSRCWYKSVQERLFAVTWLAIMSNRWGRTLSSEMFRVCSKIESIASLWSESLLSIKPPIQPNRYLDVSYGTNHSHAVTALYGKIGKKMKILRNLDDTRCRLLSKIAAAYSNLHASESTQSVSVKSSAAMPSALSPNEHIQGIPPYNKLLAFAPALISQKDSFLKHANIRHDSGSGSRGVKIINATDVFSKAEVKDSNSGRRELENELRIYENEVRRVALQDTTDRLKYLEWITKSVLLESSVDIKENESDDEEAAALRRQLKATQLNDEEAHRQMTNRHHDLHCLAQDNHDGLHEDRIELIREAHRLRDALRIEMEKNLSMIATLEGVVTELMICGRIQSFRVPPVRPPRQSQPYEPFTYRSEDWEEDGCDPEEALEGSEVGGLQYLKWCADEEIRKYGRDVVEHNHDGSWRGSDGRNVKRSEAGEINGSVHVLERDREILVKQQLDFQNKLLKEEDKKDITRPQIYPTHDPHHGTYVNYSRSVNAKSPLAEKHSDQSASDIHRDTNDVSVAPWFTEDEYTRTLRAGMAADISRMGMLACTPNHALKKTGGFSGGSEISGGMRVRDVCVALEGLRGHHSAVLERTAKATAKYCPYEFVHCDGSKRTSNNVDVVTTSNGS